MAASEKAEKIANLLREIFREKNWAGRIELHKVFAFWEAVVGKEIASHARPHLIRGKVLWVNVSDSVWMQQLHLQRMMLLERINEQLGTEKLEDIRFQLNTRGKEEPFSTVQQPGPHMWPLDKKRVEAFDHMVAALEDESLRKSLKRLWAKFEGVRYRKKEE